MTLEQIEATFRAWIHEDIQPEMLLIAFHNACIHGTILEGTDLNVTDKQLGRLFQGLDKSIRALRKMSQ